MKVTMQENYRNIYTLNQVVIAKELIKYAKDDEATPADYAVFAIRDALRNSIDGIERVIEAKATTALNSRVWNRYFDNSENLDIWVEATAKTFDGFIEVGMYLSDIWELGPESYGYPKTVDYYVKGEMKRW